MKLLFFKFFLWFFTFFYLFNPTNFSSFNLLYVLSAISSIYFLVNYKLALGFLSKKQVFIYFLFCIYIITYLFLFHLSGSSDSLYQAYNFVLVIFSLICACYIVSLYFICYDRSFDGFMGFLIKIGCIQIFFVLLSAFFPDFRDLILSSSRLDNIESISNNHGALRSFGLANGYTATFPMLMGLYALFMLGIIYNYRRFTLSVIKHFIIMLLFIFSALVNARVGLVPVILYLIVTLLTIRVNTKYISFLIKLALIVAFSIPIAIAVNDEIDKFFVRLIWAVEEISVLMEGRTVGTFLTLEQMFFFPDDFLSLLFGTGFSVYGSESVLNRSSDIGFIRNIYMFGLINSSLLLLSVFYISKSLRNILYERFGKIFLICLFLSLLAYYFKGAIWSASEAYNFYILLCVFAIAVPKVTGDKR